MTYRYATVTPRAAEVTAVAEAIDPGYKALPEDQRKQLEGIAKKAIGATFRALQDREWWIVAVKLDPQAPVITFGIFATERAAEEAIKKNSLGVYGAAAAMKVSSLTSRAAELDKMEAAYDRPCQLCGNGERPHQTGSSQCVGYSPVAADATPTIEG